jgi:hypothetical protein
MLKAGGFIKLSGFFYAETRCITVYCSAGFVRFLQRLIHANEKSQDKGKGRGGEGVGEAEKCKGEKKWLGWGGRFSYRR